MARTRNIKPSFFKNETLSDLGFDAMICFAGLWTLADREGRLEDRPRWIKAEIFPYAEVDIESLLAKLDKNGFIIRYDVVGHRYISVPNFSKHQHPNIKESASTIPAPCSPSSSTTLAPIQHQINTPLNPIPYTSIPQTSNGIHVPEKEPMEDMANRAERSMVFDEHFQEFKRLCSVAGANGCLIGGDSDSWSHAWYAWTTLDPEQKINAISWIRKRVDTKNWEDSILKSLPNTVLVKKNWDRPMAQPSNGLKRSVGDERLRNA